MGYCVNATCDVLIPGDDRQRVVLYEIYEDAEAFETHKTTSHFLQFDADTRELVRDKSLSSFALSNGT